MNKLICILILFLLIACKNVAIRDNASLGFAENQYDFGTIPYKKETIYSFRFTNRGKTPLIINEVKTSCGCTVPDWPKKPVKPGASEEIKIRYDAASSVVFHKTIEVFYNGPASPDSLEIKGEVAYPEEITESN